MYYEEDEKYFGLMPIKWFSAIAKVSEKEKIFVDDNSIKVISESEFAELLIEVEIDFDDEIYLK
ncbi:hypothetical protein SAMN02745245_00377 [Anaerosphaera aminiphila DSM 21120]|uniref:Uncharacterized protein n=1 Tax=Anaerosphaera aminiphila DSM 21120 TaxID=1120995 RepID=A0A1M5PLB5_9FIRM|nr:hypothetical protein [Anaerosphaera aminiphila]SHH02565.1 hypothetical protein SAMN02745245_00377 [Anaerosphaera aminiphila DSM 21120]